MVLCCSIVSRRPFEGRISEQQHHLGGSREGTPGTASLGLGAPSKKPTPAATGRRGQYRQVQRRGEGLKQLPFGPPTLLVPAAACLLLSLRHIRCTELLCHRHVLLAPACSCCPLLRFASVPHTGSSSSRCARYVHGAAPAQLLASQAQHKHRYQHGRRI